MVQIEIHSRFLLDIDFYKEQVPDATTLLKFRHLLEEHSIGEKIFADVNARLEKAGMIMHGGTIVDATIISAPSSTKNQTGKRDPEMHQTKKGNQWYHGMKIHSGIDAGTGYVHTITATAANVHDIDEAHNLIREDDNVVYGDSGYGGLAKRKEITSDEHLSKVEFRTCLRPSRLKISSGYTGINWEKQIENRKSSVRCKVEHPLLIVKRQFGYAKVAYPNCQELQSFQCAVCQRQHGDVCQSWQGDRILDGITAPKSWKRAEKKQEIHQL